MPWPTWDQAALAALVSAVIWLALRRLCPGRTRNAEPLAREFALIAALYALWRLARMLPLATTSGALARGREIDHIERALHLPSEVALQNFVLDHPWLASASSWYYAAVHVPALVAFLVWLFMRHREQFPHWRNGLALLTLGCLIIRFVRVAPPRFFPDLGYENVSDFYGLSVYTSDVQEGVSDQFAAMPSIHVGWAAVVSLGIVAVSTSAWRWVFLLHVVLTTLVVSATANHWWLDGIVAVGLLLVGLAVDNGVRRRFAGRRDPDPGPIRASEAAAVDAARS
ncbi:phosphatase PAP2 family protein [Nocardioides caricicola]|uniref:Phosphatase PAP2 family protein n=1 Tax=Nocardioides caricicola TaxID=634770 RepID=A0ABW0MXB1_9ACTN